MWRVLYIENLGKSIFVYLGSAGCISRFEIVFAWSEVSPEKLGAGRIQQIRFPVLVQPACSAYLAPSHSRYPCNAQSISPKPEKQHVAGLDTKLSFMWAPPALWRWNDDLDHCNCNLVCPAALCKADAWTSTLYQQYYICDLSLTWVSYSPGRFEPAQ